MNNKVVNKQIPLKSIIQIANNLEEYKEKYDKIFQSEEEKNKNLSYIEKRYEHEHGSTKISYAIEYRNGKSIKEDDYNWFIDNLKNANEIKCIGIYMWIGFDKPEYGERRNSNFNKIYVYLYFRENEASIQIDTVHQEQEAHSLYSEIMDILENNEERYNKTIKNRAIRTQCFTITVGIILSYIIYAVLKINVDKLPEVITNIVNNKYAIVFGQWIIAILLGNFVADWFISMIYKPLVPEKRYAGYNYSSHKSIYRDNVEDYVAHSEVHFGKYADAEDRRLKIEKIYKVSRICLLVQLVISVVLFLILK